MFNRRNNNLAAERFKENHEPLDTFLDFSEGNNAFGKFC